MKINVSNWDIEAAFAFFEDQGGINFECDGAGNAFITFDPQSA
jgi:hypothetical protein